MEIKVKVKPGSSKQELKKIEEGYEAHVKAPAENNKANIELIKLLKKEFGSDVKIIRGYKSRNKVVEIKE